jgi:ethanolamine utilization protein EutN
MLLGRVEGFATSTVKHPSLAGYRLTVVQPLRSLYTEPVLAIDVLGAGRGDCVLISSDGKGTRETVGDETSPARWTVVGILRDDPGRELEGKSSR